MKRRYQMARWLGHQYWLRGRGHVMSLLCPPDRQTGENFDVEFFGYRYQGLLDDFIDRHVYLSGGWELHILALMSQVARAGGPSAEGPVTYVDVGANTGQHALFMAGYADTVICFEPFAPVRHRLQERITSNGLRNVTVVPLALSAEAGSSLYYPPEGGNQGTGSLAPTFSTGNSSAGIVVNTDTGDNYFGDRPELSITILKIDVEGGERAVLEGLAQTLLRCRPSVILELSEYTRNDIGSLPRLLELLYPGAVAFTIGHAAGGAGYRLQKCDFEAPSDILVIPSGLSETLPRSASFAEAGGRVSDNRTPPRQRGLLVK